MYILLINFMKSLYSISKIMIHIFRNTSFDTTNSIIYQAISSNVAYNFHMFSLSNICPKLRTHKQIPPYMKTSRIFINLPHKKIKYSKYLLIEYNNGKIHHSRIRAHRLF